MIKGTLWTCCDISGRLDTPWLLPHIKAPSAVWHRILPDVSYLWCTVTTPLHALQLKLQLPELHCTLGLWTGEVTLRSAGRLEPYSARLFGNSGAQNQVVRQLRPVRQHHA